MSLTSEQYNEILNNKYLDDDSRQFFLRRRAALTINKTKEAVLENIKIRVAQGETVEIKSEVASIFWPDGPSTDRFADSFDARWYYSGKGEGRIFFSTKAKMLAALTG